MRCHFNNAFLERVKSKVKCTPTTLFSQKIHYSIAMKFLQLSIAVVGVLASLAWGKEPPVICPNFSVDTNEVNGSGPNTASEDGSYSTIVQQTITQDVDLRRSNMLAIGKLVDGALQQVKRCDLDPEGWYIQASGTKAFAPSTWSCTNTTISKADEGPESCQFSSFWSFPRMKYEGVEKINGQNCDKWTYFQHDDSKSQYAFWIVEDQATPAACGRITNPSNPTALYTIFFNNFSAGTQPESAYYPEQGVQCPAGTPFSIKSEQQQQHHHHDDANVIAFPSSVMELLKQADARSDM